MGLEKIKSRMRITGNESNGNQLIFVFSAIASVISILSMLLILDAMNGQEYGHYANMIALSSLLAPLATWKIEKSVHTSDLTEASLVAIYCWLRVATVCALIVVIGLVIDSVESPSNSYTKILVIALLTICLSISSIFFELFLYKKKIFAAAIYGTIQNGSFLLLILVGFQVLTNISKTSILIASYIVSRILPPFLLALMFFQQHLKWRSIFKLYMFSVETKPPKKLNLLRGNSNLVFSAYSEIFIVSSPTIFIYLNYSHGASGSFAFATLVAFSFVNFSAPAWRSSEILGVNSKNLNPKQRLTGKFLVEDRNISKVISIVYLSVMFAIGGYLLTFQNTNWESSGFYLWISSVLALLWIKWYMFNFSLQMRGLFKLYALGNSLVLLTLLVNYLLFWLLKATVIHFVLVSITSMSLTLYFTMKKISYYLLKDGIKGLA